MFMMPVSIIINNTDLFDPPNTWIHLPIINIASNGLIAVKELKSSKNEEYDLPEAAGKFVFRLLANDIDFKVYENEIYKILEKDLV